jgi:hypothetical protein
MKAQDFQKFKTKGDIRKWLREEGKASTTYECDAWMREHIPHESKFQKQIMQRISDLKAEGHGVVCWKDQSGPYQQAGIPDVLAVIDGQFFAFEVKRPFFGGATDLQLAMIERLNAAGGHAAVVTYVSEAEDVLRSGGIL